MTGPLEGLQVLELGGIGPTQFAGMFLAQLGADVVRVDRPYTVATYGFEPREDLLNHGKRSIALDLKQESVRELLLDRLVRTDILLEGFRPGVAERLGLGPTTAMARNLRLIYGRMTGWGQDGPLADRAGHDINYLALTGLLPMLGEPDRPPQFPLNILGDFAGGGCYLVIGVLAALERLRRTGSGDVVDAAILDGVTHLLTVIHALMNAGHWQPERQTNVLDGGAPFYGLYETADGRFMAVGAIEVEFYTRLLRVLDLEPLLRRQFQRDQWAADREAVAAVFRTRSQAEWVEAFADADACVTPVLSTDEAVRHPQHQARQQLVEQHGRVHANPSPRFAGSGSTRPDGPAPRPGEHTREVLQEWGFDVEQLIASGAASPNDPADNDDSNDKDR